MIPVTLNSSDKVNEYIQKNLTLRAKRLVQSDPDVIGIIEQINKLKQEISSLESKKHTLSIQVGDNENKLTELEALTLLGKDSTADISTLDNESKKVKSEMSAIAKEKAVKEKAVQILTDRYYQMVNEKANYYKNLYLVDIIKLREKAVGYAEKEQDCLNELYVKIISLTQSRIVDGDVFSIRHIDQTKIYDSNFIPDKKVLKAWLEIELDPITPESDSRGINPFKI